MIYFLFYIRIYDKKYLGQLWPRYLRSKKFLCNLFENLILSRIYELSGVKSIKSDERVKHNGALTTRPIERITKEFTAVALLE